MELVGLWRRHFSLRYVPITMIQVVSAAATIFVVAAVQAVSGSRVAHTALEIAEKNAGACIQYLREVGESFAGATSIADILQNLLQQQVQTRKARRSPGSSPSAANRTSPLISGLHPNFESNAFEDPNTFAGTTWLMGPNHPSLHGTHNNFLVSQETMCQPGGQHPSLSGILEAPFGYQQPFGDGLGESLYFPAMATLPGMNIEGILRGDPTFPGDSLMMLRSPQDTFYAYQMRGPTAHSPSF
jgi:hypothetical protein